jgi:hypothetical protein
MGIISDNLARALSDSDIDLTGFVWRGPISAPIGAVPQHDSEDTPRASGPERRTDGPGGDHIGGGGRLDVVVRPVTP